MPELRTRGIWSEDTLRDERFVRYFDIVQRHAEEMGGVFFTWAGEGRELVTDELDGENLSGWFIPADEADEFEAQWRKDRYRLDERYDRSECVAEWSVEDGEIAISFRFYNSWMDEAE